MIYKRFMPGDHEPRFCDRCAAPLLADATDAGLRRRCSGCGSRHLSQSGGGRRRVLRHGPYVLLGAAPAAAMAACGACRAATSNGMRRCATARREPREESGLDVVVGDVLAVHSNFHDRARQTVGIWFAGTALGGNASPGGDLDALAFLALAAPPPLALPTDAAVLAALRGAH
jgi:hypothetical protein